MLFIKFNLSKYYITSIEFDLLIDNFDRILNIHFKVWIRFMNLKSKKKKSIWR